MNSLSLSTSRGSSWDRLHAFPRLHSPLVWKPRQKDIGFPFLFVCDGVDRAILKSSWNLSVAILHFSLKRGFFAGSIVAAAGTGGLLLGGGGVGASACFPFFLGIGFSSSHLVGAVGCLLVLGLRCSLGV